MVVSKKAQSELTIRAKMNNVISEKVYFGRIKRRPDVLCSRGVRQETWD